MIVRFDVESLYPNVTVDETLTIIEGKLTEGGMSPSYLQAFEIFYQFQTTVCY